MQKKFLFWAALAAMVMSLSFVACDKKNVFNREDDEEETTGGGGGQTEENYSIVGSWKSTTTSNYYGDESVILQFNADHTGTYTYESSEGKTVYNINYNYDEKTCLGDLIMQIPDYNEVYPMNFKLKWYGPNTVLVYVQDAYYESYYGYEEWELMGTFQRLDANGEVINPTQNETYSIIGSWKTYLDNSGMNTLTLSFKSNGTGSYIYAYEYYGEKYSHTYDTQYTYDQKKCTGTLTIIDPVYAYEGEENPEMPFKVEWLSEDAAKVYIGDDYSGTIEWELLGLFERQK